MCVDKQLHVYATDTEKKKNEQSFALAFVRSANAIAASVAAAVAFVVRFNGAVFINYYSLLRFMHVFARAHTYARVSRERLIARAPFARGEISERESESEQRAERGETGNTHGQRSSVSLE